MSLASRLSQERAALEGEFSKVLNPHPKGTNIDSGLWTDVKLDQLVSGLLLPQIDRRTAYLIMARFYEFYFSGSSRAGDNDTAVIMEAALLLQEGGKYVFLTRPRPAGPGTKDWYTPNTSQGNFDRSRVVAHEEITLPVNIENQAEIKEYRDKLGLYDDDSHDAFVDYIDKSLARFALNEEENAIADRELQQLTSMLAFVSLRALSKEEIAVRNAYAKSQFRTNVSSLVGIDGSTPFHPPCTKFVKAIFFDFSGGGSAVRCMIALAVDAYIARIAEGQATYIPGVLSAACLMHLSRTGLGMVHLLSQACAVTGRPWRDILEYSYTSQTKMAWKAILTFLKKSVGEEGSGTIVKSWPWSRAIADSYNHGLAPRENRHLACILAAIAEPECGSGVWSAKWIENQVSTYAAFRELGYVIRHVLMSTYEDITDELPREAASRLETVRAHLQRGRQLDLLMGRIVQEPRPPQGSESGEGGSSPEHPGQPGRGRPDTDDEDLL